MVCMDLASVYRVLVRKHFPNARNLADNFHVIRVINRHFLACRRENRSGRQREPRSALAAAPPPLQCQTWVRNIEVPVRQPGESPRGPRSDHQAGSSAAPGWRWPRARSKTFQSV
jgi:hypothetical protein